MATETAGAGGAGGIGVGGTYSSAQAITVNSAILAPSRMASPMAEFEYTADLRVFSGLLWLRRRAIAICSGDIQQVVNVKSFALSMYPFQGLQT